MRRMPVLVLGAFLSLPASAATLDAIEGQILINHGEGFQPVAASTQAREGDLVMANPGGSAKLIYPGGCVTEIRPGIVVTVHDGSKCPQAMLVGEDDDCDKYADPKERDRCWCRKYRDDDTQDRRDYRLRCGVVWWPYAVGAAAAGGIAAAIILSDDDDGGGGGNGGGGLNP